MRKLDDEQSQVDSAGEGVVVEGVEGCGSGEGSIKPVGAGVVGSGVGEAPIKPKGTSITLCGAGKMDGSDINNSMSLAVAYRLVVLAKDKPFMGAYVK